MAQAAFQGGVAEASIEIPVRRTNAQLSSSALLTGMNVGVVLSYPSELSVLARANVPWDAWRSLDTSVAAGPISAVEYSTIPLAFKANDSALPGTVTVYLGANRGRGQAYPNGEVSNLVSTRWSANGVIPGRTVLAKRLGIACWIWSSAWKLPVQLIGPGHSMVRTGGLRSFSQEGGVCDVVMNVGGFGQTEEQLVIQSSPRVYSGLAFILIG